ncbi:MAG: hypothetical protein NZ750_08515 [Anaerolineae bacterium]|nr:hypothetical protein [Anaerolineae bacterium]MDW8172412.1 hypothetical protein [Anaerolineae bacterium]
MNDSLKFPPLLADFRLLLMLFVAFRASLLLAYPPFFIDGVERGIGAGGDRLYHYVLSSLEDEGLWPFRDWWSEFPPLWYLTTTGVHALLGAQASYDNWSLVLGMLAITFEVGNLALLRRIGARLHGEGLGLALAWLYAVLLAPTIFMWWNFDSWATLALLGGISLALENRPRLTGVMLGIGALVKFVPLLVLGALARFWPWRRAALSAGTAFAVFALAYVPLFALNADFALISLTAQFGKPSYQTVWALIDGNYTTGNFGTVESHLRADGVDEGVGERNPPRIPSWLRLGVALALGLAAFLRVRRADSLGLIAFVGLTFIVFYLQSQGWSPQWLSQIIPLTLLVFPSRDGVLTVVMLSVLAFVEYPFLFIRTGDAGGVFQPSHPSFSLWVLVVLARSAILVGLGWAFYRKLRQQPNPLLTLER